MKMYIYICKAEDLYSPHIIVTNYRGQITCPHCNRRLAPADNQDEALAKFIDYAAAQVRFNNIWVEGK